MAYRLGVDVGGTFTDVLLVDEASGATCRAKTPSTPAGPVGGGAATASTRSARPPASTPTAIGHGDARHHGRHQRDPRGQGRPGRAGDHPGFRQVLQIARSFVPGGLAGWIIWPKPEPLAALENTVEAVERIGATARWSPRSTRTTSAPSCAPLRGRGMQALAVSPDQLLRQRRARASASREIAAEELPGVPVSLSSRVLPEMREYERTLTTVANGYVQPRWPATCQPRRAAGRRRGRRQAVDPAQRRRAGRRPARPPRPGHDADVRPGRRRHRCGLDRRAVRAHRPAHLRHGRHLHRRRAGAGRQPADRPGDQGRRPDRAGAVGRRPHRRRRRRLDRARAGADQGAAGRAAVRRRRPRPGRVRQRAAATRR